MIILHTLIRVGIVLAIVVLIIWVLDLWHWGT
jgi:hypothetical protein